MNTESMILFDIENVYTLIHKKEAAGFCFSCPSRAWDGFVLITEGKCEFCQENGKKTELSKGEVVFLRKGDRYTIKSSEELSYCTSAFDFSAESDNTLALLPSVITCTPAQIRLLDSITEMWQSKSANSYMFCKIQLLKLYYDILNETALVTTDGADGCVSAAIEFIHKNFKRNFKGADIASYCALSESYLRKMFLQKMKMTVNEYRDTLRFKLAKELLSSGLLSVKETAYELGFCDVYYFTRFFSKHAGITPAKYKDLNSKSNL